MKTKTAKILYWSAISFMSLWFATSGLLELAHSPIVWDITVQLGYPPHFIYLLGVFKLAGVITLLIPNKLLRLKEWVFAGMFFDIIFAFFSKISIIGFSATVDTFVAFTVLALGYWSFRKLYPLNHNLNSHEAI